MKYLSTILFSMLLLLSSCTKDDIESREPEYEYEYKDYTYLVKVHLTAQEFIYHETIKLGEGHLHFMEFVLTGIKGSGLTDVKVIHHMEINGIKLNWYLQSANGPSYYYNYVFWKGHNEEIWNYITSKSPTDIITIDVYCVQR